ncbi:MAG: sugar transferase [Verrucomicrobia bacterium]|nr:sugar transferase [Verrucomicrobiota bacterium]
MLKRLFDLLAVLLTAPLWLPLLAIVAWMVRRKLGSPVLFRQKRPGYQGEIFELIKFRSMTSECGPDGKLLPDEVRLTAFGRWLRATSLDELPELLNILRGEMSLVGPRPLLIAYLPRYSARQARRHEVRPGLTGLAQVMGRNALSWEEKFEWDVTYVEQQSLWLDLKILFLTVKTVLFRTGISAQNEATMPEFNPTGRDSRA